MNRKSSLAGRAALAVALMVGFYLLALGLCALAGFLIYADLQSSRIHVKLWAFAHLLSNGRLADVLLFAAFLVWAIVSFISARRRDRAAGTVYPAGDELRTVLTVVAGVGAWAVLVTGLHQWLIGVPPFV